MSDQRMGVEGDEGPLCGVRVADVTDLRGALAARILADLGAEVTRIERPGAVAAALAGPDADAHRFRNHHKRIVELDLHTTAGQTELHHRLADADVLIENLGPVHAADHGLDPDHVVALHPALVHVALSDLGATGPRAGWHLEPLPALAASGALHASGFPHLPPVGPPGYLAHDCASVFGALAAVAGLVDRRRHGHGQLVDISTQEAALSGLNPWSIALEDYLRVNPMLPAEGRRNADATYWVLPAADGWVRTVIGSARQWAGFVALLGNPDTFVADEWNDPTFRIANTDVIRAVAAECLTDRTRAELVDEALPLGATVGVLHRLSEFVGHPQTRHRAFFDTAVPGAEGLPFAATPFRLAAAPAAVAATTRASSGLVLDGVRVVEFGVAAVVPELCWVLSELGADVVKIESATHPDVLRQTGGAHPNRGFAFNAECRGRRSVALDLSTVEGRRLAFELCARADVVAENQRGGVLDRLGLGYETVAAVNPGVVYACSQGYGRGGPLGEMPAYGPLNSGFAGVHLLWNHPDAPYPCGTSLNHPDHIAGKLLAVAVLAALDQRDRTGVGRLVELAQTEAAAYLIGDLFLASARAGVDPEPVGNRHPHAAPHGVYRCAGDDRWVAIAVTSDEAWERLCMAVPLDPSGAWATLAGRLADRGEIDARLGRWTVSLEAEAAAAHLQAAGVSAMPVQGPRDHHADGHLAERRFIVTLEHPEVGHERHTGNPMRFSRLALRTAASAPCLGADTAEVLGELGLTPAEVDHLVATGVCR